MKKMIVIMLLLTGCGFGYRIRIENIRAPKPPAVPVDRPLPTLVTNPTERMEFHGFSILPPRGEKWFLVDLPAPLAPPWKRTVMFFKVVGKLHSVYAAVDTADFPDVAAMTSTGRTAILQELRSEILEEFNPRFKPLDVKASLDKCLGYDCLRYKKVAEDHSPRDVPGYVLILTQEGFVVPHPHSPTFFIWVWVQYSQRFPPGQKPFPIEAELEPFLTSLAFTPPR